MHKDFGEHVDIKHNRCSGKEKIILEIYFSNDSSLVKKEKQCCDLDLKCPPKACVSLLLALSLGGGESCRRWGSVE